jgi:hypothetical protein
MVNVTIEYVILLPMLVLPIIIFPMVANIVMNPWMNSTKSLALQNVADQMGSTLQQLYFSLNHQTMKTGTITQESNLPRYIGTYAYTGNATLKSISDSALNSSKALTIMLSLTGAKISVTTMAILGQNVLWRQSTFISNSANACVTAQKFSNGTVLLAFGG